MVAAHDIQDGVLVPSAGDLALVVAAHGNDEVRDPPRPGLEAGVRYVGLVAEREARRGEWSTSCEPRASRRICSRPLETPAGTRHRRSDTPRGSAPRSSLDIIEVSARRVARPSSHARGGGPGAEAGCDR